ncbi:TPA: MerR family transcriptional regulator, partial [Aeromonas hydrophila]|nr:MerR family transcriptional regulator [Aeromonas hydrophila]
GLVQPARTEKGHRLYSEQDIRQIGEILSWLERGVSIGQVKGLLSEPQAQPVSDHWQQTLEQFSQALLAFNQRKAEAELNDLLASYPFELVRSRVLQPLVERLLGLWRERPDGELLQQVWLGWLHTRFARHLIEQEKGMPATLASWGQVGPLDLVWAAYELIGQGHEVQLLGAVEPRHASLLEGRAVTPWLVLLGAGLGKQELAAVWPAGTRFFGELGRLYDGEWLQAHGWQASLAELMVDAPAAAGAGGRGRKKS